MRTTRASLGLESVDFQNSFLFDALVAEFEKTRMLTYNDFLDLDPTDPESPQKRLSTVVFQHTKLKVNFVFGKEGPSVSFPKTDRNHPLLNAMRRDAVDSKDGMALIKVAGGHAHGLVNITTGTASGVFAEIESTIYLPVLVMSDKKFSNEELAAITLHEIGHVFVYFEYLSRTVSTNQALAGISRSLDRTSTQKQRETVLVAARDALRLKTVDVEELSKISDRRVAEVVLVTNVVERSRAELGADIYDENSYEYLADQFAARYGAGRYMVTALDKIYRGAHHISVRTFPAYLCTEFLKFSMLAVGVCMGASGLAYAGGSFVNGAIITMMADAQSDATYDRPKIRLQRIRNQLVERQKLKDLASGEHETIKEDLVVIDGLLKDYNARFQIVGMIALHVFRMGKRRFDAEALQQELESLAANDLFGSAHDLRALA